MANHYIIKRNINGDRLRSYIENKTNISELGRRGGYSRAAIYKGLKEERMSLGLIMYLAKRLNVPANLWADVPFEYSLEELF